MSRAEFNRRQREAFVKALREQPSADPGARARKLLNDGLTDHEAAALVDLSANDVRRAASEQESES